MFVKITLTSKLTNEIQHEVVDVGNATNLIKLINTLVDDYPDHIVSYVLIS